MAIRFLYFDLGNVLLSFSSDEMCRRMADVARVPVETVRQLLLASDDASDLQRQFETGRLCADGYYACFCEQSGTRPDRTQLEAAASDIFMPIAPVMNLLDRLASRRHRIGILSNTNAIHWQFITDGRYPLLAEPGRGSSPFELAILSYEVGVMKPDARIYEIAVARAGVPPGEIFFVDDREENVAAAQAAGIDAVQFVDAAALKAALGERGIAAS